MSDDDLELELAAIPPHVLVAIAEQALALRQQCTVMVAGSLGLMGFPAELAVRYGAMLTELAIRHTPFAVRIPRYEW